MRESLFSPLWYRVADLKPRLRSHVRVSRHHYRGQLWFVLQDQLSSRHHRLNASAYEFAGRLDGERSVQEIWDAVVALKGEGAPSQDEALQILAQLNEADLLHAAIMPDISEAFRRRDARKQKRRRGALNPMAFRVPLVDPTRLLNRGAQFVRPLFHPVMLVLWAAVVGFGLLAALTHWAPIKAHAAVYMLTPKYLFLLWLCYPIIKAVHELGHAFATRVWGGEVHEMGVTLFLLIPVPYVDASAATAFREKGRRMIVGAVGVMVELLLAALATVVWLNLQDGLVRDIAFITMFVGSVSTLLFNGNPLMRFDGYYVLSDALDLPNLGPRSNAYLMYLAQRYLLGIKSLPSPATNTAERLWLFSYGVASWIYRIFLSVLITFWLTAKSVLLGMVAGIWMFVALLLKPVAAGFRFLLTSPRLAARRLRAIALAGAAVAGVSMFVFLVPMPHSTGVHGVVWLPEQAQVRAGTDGFIEQILVADGQRVVRGEPLVILSDPELAANKKRLHAQLTALEVERQDALVKNPVRAQSIGEAMRRYEGEIHDIDERVRQLTVSSAVDGIVAMPKAQDALHGFAAKGTLLAQVLPAGGAQIRVVVPQSDVALVRDQTRAVDVRLAEAPGTSLAAQVVRAMPAATNELPSAALGDRAGGPFATDIGDSTGLRTLEPVFLVDLAVASGVAQRVGGRVEARFKHGSEPLAARAYRAVALALLLHFTRD